MRLIWLASAQFLALIAVQGVAAQRARDLTAPGSLAAELADPGAITAPRDIVFDATFGTSLPLSVGIEGRLETSFGLTAHASVGHTPAAYMGMVAAILQGSGAYPTNVGPAVGEATGNGGWNVRLGLGMLLFDGLEIDAGYTFITASSSLDPSAIQAATGQPAPWGSMNVPMSVNIHALHVRVGWRWVVAEHLVLRAGIGWTQAIGSDVHLTVPDAYRAMAQTAEDGVHTAVGRFGFTPEVIISAGYRF